jgi:hypothetical protein
MTSIQHPLDIVISYVNSTDSKWSQKIHSLQLPMNPVRHNFHGEIFFSLLLLQKNMSWVHRIFILHDEQPFSLSFLSPSFQEKITFIDHKDFIPHEYLPTFNSQVIECFLPKIPELSEYFLYMNDDFFITKPVSYSTFFNGNKMKIFIERRKHRYPNHKLIHAPVLLDRDVSSQVFAIEMKKPILYIKFEHLPFCFHRPTLENAFSIFFKYFDKTCKKNKIRTYDVNHFQFHHHFQNYTNFSALTIYLHAMIRIYHAHVIPFQHVSRLSIALTNPMEFQKIMVSNPLFLNIQKIHPSLTPYWNKIQQKFLFIPNLMPKKKLFNRKKPFQRRKLLRKRN